MVGASFEARARAAREPALAMGRSRAGVAVRPRSAAMQPAGPGQKRSGEPLATRMRPRSSGATPALARQSRAARWPRVPMVSAVSAKRRSRMPDCEKIQSGSTPSWGASSSFETMRSGRLDPKALR